MTITNHVLTGAVIALAVSNPALAIGLAFISHFLTDILPHYAPRKLPESTIKILATADTSIAIVIVLLIAAASTSVSPWLIFACATAAALPDIIWAWRYYKIKNVEKLFDEPMSKFSKWHLRIQHESSEGAIVELAWSIGLVVLIANRL
jgi:hypothetical protein